MDPRNANLNAARIQTPHAQQGDSDVEPWEPPFERWIRLADDLLANAGRSDQNRNRSFWRKVSTSRSHDFH